jgi:low temperature requirement protein LtrA
MATPNLSRTMSRSARLLRDRRGPQPVTALELFFDLVYVFAVTQLADALLAQLTWAGAAQTLLLLLAVWWAWITTTWFTSLVDSDQPEVRLVVLALMFLSLVMAVALPEAFGVGGIVFVTAFLLMQFGRALFLIVVLRGHPLQRIYERIVFTLAIAAVPLIAGAVVAPGLARTALWAVAVGILYVQFSLGFPTPRLGRARLSERVLAGGHWAERCLQFLLIALGESLLVIGATVGAGLLGLSHAAAGGSLAFTVAFAAIVAMWWIVFERTDERAATLIAAAAEPGRLVLVYVYTYVVMVAGILVIAVGNTLILDSPLGRLEPAGLVALLGGPALFLAGHALFERAMFDQWPSSHLVALLILAGLAVLAALAPVGLQTPPLVVAGASTVLLMGVAAAHTLTQRTPSRRGRVARQPHQGQLHAPC